MHALLATGPAWPSVGHAPGGSFDWSPLLMVLAALLVAPLVFGIRLTARSIGALVLGGIALGLLGSDIGAVPAVCVGLIALAMVSLRSRRFRARRSPTVLELPD